MKQLKNKILAWILLFAMAVTSFVIPAEEARAEVIVDNSSYYDTDDPKGFMKTLTDNRKDALFANGKVYFVTMGKLASNPNNLRYKTIGYTIKVSSGKHSIEIEVDADGGAYFKDIKVRNYENVEYTLRGITYNDIVKLCENKVGKSATSFQSIFSNEYVTIRFDAIVTLKQNGIDKDAVIAEDGRGGITFKDNVHFRLKNADELKALQSYGFSNNFDSYHNIETEISNPILTINYHNNVKGQSSIIPGATEQIRQLQSTTIKDGTSLGLSKTGYTLTPGSEWKNDNGKIFAAGNTYMASDLNSAINYGSATVNLYPNFKPITYTLKYDANGGKGSMSPETHTYDEGYFTPKHCTFTKDGYSFKGWQLTNVAGGVIPVTSSMVQNSSDVSLAGEIKAGTKLKNLVTTPQTLVLKAIWEPNEYEITLIPQAPPGKIPSDYTEKFFVKYNNYFSLISGGSQISSITLPVIEGYNFIGYFLGNGEGREEDSLILKAPYDESVGIIAFLTNTFTKNTTLLGQWEPKKATITLELDTIEGGKEPHWEGKSPDYVKVLTTTYDEALPAISGVPVKDGYTFKGFYTEKDGKGEQYYNAALVSDKICDFTGDLTLYAHWVDEIAPVVEIKMEVEGTWSNSGDNRLLYEYEGKPYTGNDKYDFTVTAKDKGSGVDKLYIYRENEVDEFELYKEIDGKGELSHMEACAETQEGAIRYKAYCVDKAGNISAEYHATCYYDKTSPIIFEETSVVNTSDLTSIKATIYATDSNVITLPGLYDANGTRLVSWEDSGIDVESNYTSSTYKTNTKSPYYVMANKYKTTVKVILPDTIKKIGNYAFYGCTPLKEIYIPEGVTSIGMYAVANNKNLKKLTLPNSITEIQIYAFFNNPVLEKITIPGYVSNIGNYAFGRCLKLSEVKYKGVNYNAKPTITLALENNEVTLGTSIFANTALLDAGIYDVDGNLLSNWEASGIDITQNLSTTSSDSNYYANTQTSAYYVLTNTYPTATQIILPTDITSIGTSAFAGCTNLTDITIAGKITTVPDKAFYNCTSLSNVTLPNSVTSIGNEAFRNCRDLTNIYIPTEVKTIGTAAFYGCTSLTSVNIPDGITSLSGQLFSNCTSLSNVTIPDSVKSISSYAFSGCVKLTGITIPNSVTSLGSSAFTGCSSLTNIVIPDSVTYAGASVFASCKNLNTVTLSKNMKTIPDRMFYNSGLTQINIPEGVTKIGNAAFVECLSLQKVIIPSTMQFITINQASNTVGLTPFDRCSALREIVVASENPYYDSRYGCNAIIDTRTRTLIVGGINTQIPGDITTIGVGAFRGKAPVSVTFPESVKEIKPYAFYECGSLVSVYIPYSVDTIGTNAFGNCSKLTSGTFKDITSANTAHVKWTTVISTGATAVPPSSVLVNTTSVASMLKTGGNWEKTYNPGLYDADGVLLSSYDALNVNVETDNVATGNSIYRKYPAASILVLPEGITKIGSSAFSMYSPAMVVVPEGVTSIGAYAFRSSPIEKIILPDSLTTIGSKAFVGTSLTTLVIPDNVTSVTGVYDKTGGTLEWISLPYGVEE